MPEEDARWITVDEGERMNVLRSEPSPCDGSSRRGVPERDHRDDGEGCEGKAGQQEPARSP